MKNEHAYKILNAFALNVISAAKANLKKEKKDVTGKLSNSLTYQPSKTPTGFSLAFLMEQYGEFQDKGVSGVKQKFDTPFSYKSKGGKRGLKGMPPPSAFDQWAVRKKGLKGIRDKKGRFLPRKITDFLLARSVFLKGIKPSLFFTEPFEKYWNSLPEGFVENFAIDIERNINEQLNKK